MAPDSTDTRASTHGTAAADSTPRPFIVTPALRQRLDLLHHLLDFGQQLIIVSGAPGSGRSALLERLAGEMCSRWQVIAVDGRDLASPSASTADATQTQDTLSVLLASLPASESRPAVVIDNGDALDDATLAELVALSTAAAGRVRVVVAAIADEGFAERVAAVHDGQAEPGDDNTVAAPHIVDVPALDAENLDYLLAHDDAQNLGWAASAGVDALLRDSRGLMGAVVRKLSTPARRRALPGAGRLVVTAVVLAALVLAALALRAPQQPDATARVELQLPQPAAPTAPPMAPGRSEVSSQAPATEPPSAGHPGTSPGTSPGPTPHPTAATSVEAARADPLADGVPAPVGAAESASAAAVEPDQMIVAGPAEASEPSLSRPDTDDATDAAPAAEGASGPPRTELPAVDDSPVDEPVSKVADASAAPEPPEAAAGPAPGLPAPASDGPAGERTYSREWVLTQNPKSYVIQLFGVRDRKAAERFQANNPLSEPVLIFDLEHQDAPWYIVVAGHYPDRDSAAAAITRLPAALRTAPPWPRPVGSLENKP